MKKPKKIEIYFASDFNSTELEKIQNLSNQLGTLCQPYGPGISMTAMLGFMTAIIDSCFDGASAIRIYEETARHFINQIKAIKSGEKEQKNDNENRNTQDGKKKTRKKVKDSADG